VAGTNNPLSIWLLSDGAHGHLSQSRGIAEAIGRFIPVKTYEIDLKVRRRLLKSLLRYLLPVPAKLAKHLLGLVYRLDLPQEQPALIVSSGGNTLLANALLAQIYQVPNLYSGTLKKYPAQCYSKIYSITSQDSDNNCILPLPPVPLNLTEPVCLKGTDAPLLVLVGGDGAGYLYSNDDWKNFAEGLNLFAGHLGVRLLLTTSRRTGDAAEKILQEILEPSFVEEAVYYGRTPRAVVRDFLSLCQGVLVTEDSLTMVAEAIYSGLPIVTLRPKHAQPGSNDSMALAGYASNCLIVRQPLAELGNLKRLPERASSGTPDVPTLIWESVRELLKNREGSTHVGT
jgi:mitochondrial fission protein ELM1